MRIKDFTDTIRHLTDSFNILEARRMIQENPALTQEQFKAGGRIGFAKAGIADPANNVEIGQDLGTGVQQRVKDGRIRYTGQRGSIADMKKKGIIGYEYKTLEEAQNRRKELIETFGELYEKRPEKQKLSWEKLNEDPDFEEFFKKEIKANPNIKKVADKYNLGENNLEELFNKVRQEVTASENVRKGSVLKKGERLIHASTLRRLKDKFVYKYKPSIGTIDIKTLAEHSHLSRKEIAKLLASAERPSVDPLFGKTTEGIWEESAIKRGKHFKKVLEDTGIKVDKRPADPVKAVRNITDKKPGRYIIKANPEQLKKLSETKIFKKGEGVPVGKKDMYSSLSKTSDEYIKFGYSQDRTAIKNVTKAINRSMDAMSFDELATYIKKNKKLRDLVELSFDGVNGTFTKVPIDDMTEGQLRQFSRMEADHIRGRSTVKFDDATRKILSGLDIEYPKNLYVVPNGINVSVKQKVERFIADNPNEIEKIKNIDQKFKDAQISYWNKNTGSYGGYKPKASSVDLTHMDIELEELLNKHKTYKDVHGVERAVVKDKDLLIKKVNALNEQRLLMNFQAAEIPCIKGVGGQCNSVADYRKGFNELVQRGAAKDKAAVSKLQKFTNLMKKAKGPAKWTGYGLLAEVGFMVPFAAADYASGESWKRIIGNATDWGFGSMFGQSEDEEIISYLPKGSLGAETEIAKAAHERLQALEDPNRNFPKGRIGMDPQRFQKAQTKVMEDAALDLRKKLDPFMEGPRDEYFNTDLALQSMEEWQAAQKQVQLEKLKTTAERQERGFIAEKDWAKNLDYRGYRDGGIVSLLKK